MKNIKNRLYTALEISYNFVIGNYLKAIEEDKQLKNQVKSLDSDLIEMGSESRKGLMLKTVYMLVQFKRNKNLY